MELPGDPGLEVAIHVLVGHRPKTADIAPDLSNKILVQRPGGPEPDHRLDVGATGAAIESRLATPALR